MRGTLVPGILRWSWSSSVERGTPNKPDSTDDRAVFMIQWHKHVKTLSSELVWPSICLQHAHVWTKWTQIFFISYTYQRHWPLTLTLSALWAFTSIPHVSNRALISMRTSLRTFFMSSAERSPTFVCPVLSWDTRKSCDRPKDKQQNEQMKWYSRSCGWLPGGC